MPAKNQTKQREARSSSLAAEEPQAPLLLEEYQALEELEISISNEGDAKKLYKFVEKSIRENSGKKVVLKLKLNSNKSLAKQDEQQRRLAEKVREAIKLAIKHEKIEVICSLIATKLENQTRYREGIRLLLKTINPDYQMVCIAAKTNNPQITDFLLQEGVSQTVVNEALKQQNIRILKFLLNSGASLDCGEILEAIFLGDIKTINFLLEESLLSPRDLFSGLEQAFFRQKDRVRKLLETKLKENNFKLLKQAMSLPVRIYDLDSCLESYAEESAQENTEIIEFLKHFKTLYSDLLAAAESGNCPKIMELGGQGLNYNLVCDDDLSLLDKSVIPGNIAAIELLLTLGLKPSSTTLVKAISSGEAEIVHLILGRLDESLSSEILCKAIDSKNLDIVAMILSKGVDTSGFIDVLLHAAKSKNLRMVQLLKEKGLKIRECNFSGGTLNKEVMLGNIEIVDYLLENGASPNRMISYNYTDADYGLNYVARLGRLDLVRLLFKYKAKTHANTLSCGIESGRIILVRFLLDNITASQYLGNSFLVNQATSMGNYMMVELLIEHGLKPDIGSLNSAIKLGRIDLVTLFLKHDIPLQTKDAFNSINIAIQYKKLNMLKFLLRNGAEPNEYTLNEVVRSENIEIAGLVRELDVQANNSEVDDVTAFRGMASNTLNIAIRLGNHVMQMIALEKGAKPNSHTFNVVASMGRLDLVKYYRNIEGSINHQTLDYAIKSGNSEVISYVISNGAKPICKATPSWDSWDNTLNRAISTGNSRIIDLVLLSGISTENITNSGLSPLQQNKFLERQRFLLEERDIRALNLLSKEGLEGHLADNPVNEVREWLSDTRESTQREVLSASWPAISKRAELLSIAADPSVSGLRPNLAAADETSLQRFPDSTKTTQAEERVRSPFLGPPDRAFKESTGQSRF